jgi:hypothetical protein
MDQYLDGLSDGTNVVYPPDTHNWRPARPTKHQQALIQDSIVADQVRMRIMQEDRQAEIEAGMGGGYDAGSDAKKKKTVPTVTYVYKTTGTGLTPNINNLRFYNTGTTQNGQPVYYDETGVYRIFFGGFPWVIQLINIIGPAGAFSKFPPHVSGPAGVYNSTGAWTGTVTIAAI